MPPTLTCSAERSTLRSHRSRPVWSNVRRFGVVFTTCVGAVACSGGSPDISVTNAQILQPVNPDVVAVYLDITNAGAEPDTLVGATADRGESSIHRSGVSPDGVATMEHVESVEIAANDTTRFVTGGYHLMIDNPGPLVAGDTVAVTLSFETSAPITVDASVVASLREDDYDR